MKKAKQLTALLLALVLTFALAGCGKDKKSSDSASTDENLVNVEITIPSDFLDEESKEEATEEAKEEGIECTVNEDGSLTYKMSKAKHKELLKEFASDFDEDANELINEGTSSIKELTHNKDFTEITAKVSSADYLQNIDDSLLTYVYLLYGGFYQIFSGVPAEETNTVCKIIDIDTGEEIETISLQELLSE